MLQHHAINNHVMTKHASILSSVLVASLTLLLPRFFMDCPDDTDCDMQPRCLCDDTCADGLNPNFEFQFDAVNGWIDLQNVNSSGRTLAASFDGLRWSRVGINGRVVMNNSNNSPGPCPIALRDQLNPNKIFAYQGQRSCQCAPKVNEQAIYNAVEDAELYPLIAETCRCQDYDFVFPDGKEVSAFNASLELHLAKKNQRTFSVSQIDITARKVYLQ